MEPDYKRAIKMALGEKRMWPAGLLTALAFSEAWWIVFGWGPEYLGERWQRALGDRLGDAGAFIVFLAAALAAFVALKAVGYLGEMVLVRQVADEKEGEMPTFDAAFSASRHRYITFAVTLLPWDALRLAVIYLPALIIAVWDRLDPDLDQMFLYSAVMLLWFALLVAVYFLAGVTAALAARYSLVLERGIPLAWREGGRLLRGNANVCLVIWLQTLAADILFVVIAWPLSALLPWVAGQIADPIGFAPARWFIYLVALVMLAGSLIIMETFVQVYKSTLWTINFLKLTGIDKWCEEEPSRSPLTDLSGPPPEFMPFS